VSKLAKLLCAARLEAGLSLRELSRRLDCNPSYVHRVEGGELQPSEERIRAICEVLETDADRLMQQAGIVPHDVIRYIARTPGVLERLRREMGREMGRTGAAA
jgi:transcriptional regulator with XRE-family HTH domain